MTAVEQPLPDMLRPAEQIDPDSMFENWRRHCAAEREAEHSPATKQQ